MLSWDDKADSEKVNKKVINKNVTAYWLRLIRRNIHTKPKLMNSNYETASQTVFSTITRYCFSPRKKLHVQEKARIQSIMWPQLPDNLKKQKTSQIYHFGRTRMGMLRHRPLPLGLVTMMGAHISGSWREFIESETWYQYFREWREQPFIY